MSNIKLFFAGDFCSKPSTSLIHMSEELKSLICSCDLKVVNFEVPLKPNVDLPKQGRERFFQNDDAPSFLNNLGFNLFSMANNHTFDWDDYGFRKTKAVLGEAAFGAGTYDEAYMVKIVEVKGRKIGFLALSFAAYKGVFDDVMNHDGLGCAYINDLKVNHVIIEAKKELDYLFVLPHDGIEYIDVPLPETIARYRDFIDYGADGVIASHPHCPQGWETYKEKPIFYSLGNFFFNSKETPEFHCTKPHWYEGRCVVITLDEGRVGSEVVNTTNVNNIGVEIDKSEESKIHNRTLCSLLSDEKLYSTYLMPKLQEQFKQDMLKIDTTVHLETLRLTFKAMLECFKRKLKKQQPVSDNKIKRIFAHDLFRYVMIRTIRND